MSESISLATGTARLWRSPDHCPQAMSPPGQPLRSAYVVLKDSLASDLLSADGGQPSGRAGATPFLPLWPDDVRIHPEFDPGARRRQSVLGADDRKSTRLNSSHVEISYAVFCSKKKKEQAYSTLTTTKKKKQKKN